MRKPCAYSCKRNVSAGDCVEGQYEGRQLVVENDALIYHWRGRFALRLEPLGDDLFAVEGTSDYRFRLVSEGDRVVGLERIEPGGERQLYPRLNQDVR